MAINSVTCPSAKTACSGKAAGFTLVEILITLAIVATLAAVSIPAYNNYIEKAKLTLAVNTMGATRKVLENYFIDNGGYPLTIDFATGLDGLGKVVLSQDILENFRSSIFSIESYTPLPADYTLIVRAKDARHTFITLTNHALTQGP